MSADQPAELPDDVAGLMGSRIMRDLLRAERSGERMTVEVGPYSAAMLIALAQFTAGRRSTPDVLAEVCRHVTGDLEAAFSGTSVGDLAAASWAEVDRTRAARAGGEATS